MTVIGEPFDPEEVKTAIGIAAENDMVKIEQPSTDWSEEDEDTLNTIVNHIRNDGRYSSPNLANKYADFVLLLKPQKHWKPSEEQMYNLSEAAHYNCAFFDMEILKGLYDDLKKLKG